MQTIDPRTSASTDNHSPSISPKKFQKAPLLNQAPPSPFFHVCRRVMRLQRKFTSDTHIFKYDMSDKNHLHQFIIMLSVESIKKNTVLLPQAIRCFYHNIISFLQGTVCITKYVVIREASQKSHVYNICSA